MRQPLQEDLSSFPQKNFPGDGQKVEVAAEIVVTQRHRPLGASLDLGVPLGNLTIFNKDSEFSRLIFFSNNQRRRFSVN